MKGRHTSRMLGLSALLASLAACQAAPSAVETVAAALPAAADPAALDRLLGYPAPLRRPGASAPAAPGFRLKADEFWGIELTITSNAGDQDHLDMAFASAGVGYLAVWQDARNGAANHDIYGQRVTASGTTTGSAFAITSNTGMQMGPRIAYNSTGTEFMVAWTDSRNGNLDVYTQRVTTAGATTGSALAVASGSGNQILAGLAYHATQNQYLLSWTDDASGSQVLKAGRITAANAATGTNITVSATAGALASGGIAVQGTGDYACVWANGTTAGIYGQKVTSAGALSGSALTIASGSGYEFYLPRIVYNPVTPGYLVAYERRTTATEEADAFTQRLTTAWALSGSAAAVTSATGAQLGPAIAVNSTTGRYLIAWADGRAGGEELDVYAKAVAADGSEVLAESEDSPTGSLQAAPALAYNASSQQFMTAYQDSRNYATSGWNLILRRAVTTLMTPAAITQETLDILNSFEPGTAGGVNGARSQIENAIAKIAAGNDANAITHLNNFISQINGISDAILTPEEKALLIALAQAAIASLQ